MQVLEICVPVMMITTNIAGQACCWYTIANWCGCIEYEQEQVHTQSPAPQQRPYNPFESPNGVPKDSHLQPAYR